MIITCSGFTSRVQNGKIILKIEDAQPEEIEELIYVPEIARLLGKSTKQIYRLSTRKKNPLPLHRGNGRPYGFKREINHWLWKDKQGEHCPAFDRLPYL